MSMYGLKTNGPIAGRLSLVNLTADTTLTVEDTGKVFLLDAIGEAIIIPAANTASRGVWYRFVMNAKCVTTSWTITSSGTSDMHINIDSGGASEASTITAGSGDDAVTFVFTAADEGDMIEMYSTGTFWMVTGNAHATANITAA